MKNEVVVGWVDQRIVILIESSIPFRALDSKRIAEGQLDKCDFKCS